MEMRADLVICPKIRTSFLKKFLLFSFSLRFITHLFAAFFPIFLPEVWRQSDTLGVSLRYFLKFTQESGPLALKFLPAVLQSGDGSGVMPMEFPFLNLLFSPFWFLGPEVGRAVIYFFLTLLIYGFSYFLFRISRGWYRWGFLLFPTVSYSADYFAKFMPDTLSFLLVLASVILPVSILAKNSWVVRRASLFAALGILMKPTSVVGLLFYFVIHANFNKEEIKVFLKRYSFSVVVGGLYYTLGLKFLDHFRDGPALFATTIKNPLESWCALAKNYGSIYGQLSERPFFAGGTLLMVIALFYRFKKMRVALSIFCIQFLIVAALDGEHSFTHDYYYEALSPTCCFLMVYALFVLRKKWIGALILLALMVRPLELSAKDFKRSWLGGKDPLIKECNQIREKTPHFPWKTGFAFRSNIENFPTLGLCFGERENSASAKYGFYYRENKPLDDGCKTIENSERLILVQCDGS
jgi:hypothetical protein